MDDPTRVALAAFALGLGVLSAAPPVLAQAADDVSSSAATTTPFEKLWPNAAEAAAHAANAARAARAAASADYYGPPTAESAPVESLWPNAANAAHDVGAATGEPPDPQTQMQAPSADTAPTSDEFSVPANEIEAVESSSTDTAEAVVEEPQQLDRASPIAARMARWVATSGDNGGRPFVIVDKTAADVFAFDADGRLEAGTPALLGLAPGDDSADGVGDRNLYAIPPDERTTPAGRFLAGFGSGRGHRKILWVDYATAISLHPVVTTNPKERRLERIRSPAPEDRRITYGCINVPASFYRDVVLKAFAGGGGVVYILPETRPLAEVFPAFASLAGASPAPPDPTGVQGSQPVSDPGPSAASADQATENASESQDPQQARSLDPMNTAGADTWARPW